MRGLLTFIGEVFRLSGGDTPRLLDSSAGPIFLYYWHFLLCLCFLLSADYWLRRVAPGLLSTRLLLFYSLAGRGQQQGAAGARGRGAAEHEADDGAADFAACSRRAGVDWLLLS